jgi:glucose/arabinose dehydrogenase
LRAHRAIWLIALAVTASVASVCGGSPTTSPSGSTTTGPEPASTETSSPSGSPIPKVHAEVVATVKQPLAMAFLTGDPALYIVSKKGAVWALRDGRVDPKPVLDLSDQVSRGSEQGLLGLAFSPSGAFAYVNYTDRRGDTNVVEYAWRSGRAVISSRRPVLFVDQPFPNHNGGNLVFGPDGFLYIGLGDGGSDINSPSPGDPHRNGQNLGVLLGKMLRIAPRMPDGSLPPGGAGYVVPADNPFVGQKGARPEIWAYGLRHPWRYSFDATTGDLWIGDVGAGAREEVDMQPAGSPGGQNYGWSNLEGTFEWRTPPANAVPPVYEYPHQGGGACSITGGYVYRASAIQDLSGWYVFGDYCTGVIHVLRMDAGGGRRVYVATGAVIQQLSSFGQDQRGELYAMSLAGEVFKLIP